MDISPTKKALRLIEKQGIVRSRDLEARGVSRTMLAHLVDEELVVREARGLYVSARHEPSQAHTLVQVALRVPEAVFCLLTALRFHELTTQAPSEVWIAIAEKARRPNLDHPRLRVARFSATSLTTGVETHKVEGVKIRVTSAAKTVADCFKYRNKIGVDVAVEALRDFSRQFRGGSSELARCARVCRVSRVMQPYLDSIT
jgi:predicted transcriptional regulator of viral defense system